MPPSCGVANKGHAHDPYDNMAHTVTHTHLIAILEITRSYRTTVKSTPNVLAKEMLDAGICTQRSTA